MAPWALLYKQRGEVGRDARHGMVHRRLRLEPDVVIQPWEDGLRTDPSAGTFEWWYFDCHLDDGSKLTIEFHTKPPYVSPSSPSSPYVSLTLDRPDGTHLQQAHLGDAHDFAASTAGCDVRIGRNTFAGDLHDYRLHVELDGTLADVALHAEVPAWRPATGHVFFGDDEQHYVAWLPAVPRAAVTATLDVGGQRETLAGVGYHDHNWGNVALRKVIDHWYWGRARVGAYTVVSLMFVSGAAYGSRIFPAFMVAKDGEILASAVGPERIGFTTSLPGVNSQTGVPVAGRLEYDVAQGRDRFRVAFVRREDVFQLDFGRAGAYHRFTGDVLLEHRVDERPVGSVRDDALWELLYFGARPAVGPT